MPPFELRTPLTTEIGLLGLLLGRGGVFYCLWVVQIEC